jgi:hypothetical protein
MGVYKGDHPVTNIAFHCGNHYKGHAHDLLMISFGHLLGLTVL